MSITYTSNLETESSRCLRALLQAADFTSSAVGKVLGVEASVYLENNELAPLVHRLTDSSALAILTRMLVAGIPCHLEEVESILGRTDLASCQDAGVVQVVGSEVIPLMTIQPYGELLIASDAKSRRFEQDYVMGLSGPSRALAGLTIRRPVETVIDIGCGSGLQALIAASHSERVLAYDLNPRALAFTKFNAELNGIANIDCRQADLFAFPMDDMADLVVSNPPYVVSPDACYAYRDSGRDEDFVCRHLASLIPQLLKPDGVGQFLANWAVHGSGSWRDMLAGWFQESRCDVSILCETIEAASSYAAKWLRQTDPHSLSAGNDAFDRWMDYFSERGIAGIGYGLVSMRPCSGAAANAFIDDAPSDYIMPCGLALEGFLNRKRLLSHLGDDELRVSRLKPSADLVLEESTIYRNGKWLPASVRASLTQGLCWSESLEPELAAVFGFCDGMRSLKNILDGMEGLGNASGVLTGVRRAIERGMLELT